MSNIHTNFIAFLDKKNPPNHSFVNGMLAKLVGDRKDISVRLVVSSGEDEFSSNSPSRFYNATCVPILLKRNGLKRFINAFIALYFLVKVVHKSKSRGNRVVVFVRNSPICLAAACVMNRIVDKVIFQSSHPHEIVSKSMAKRWGAKVIYWLCSKSVDCVVAVSPVGLKRVQKLFPGASEGVFIPLLADVPGNKEKATPLRSGQTVRFTYIGTHSDRRNLHILLRGIVLAVKNGADGTFVFVGGSKEEIKKLKQTKGVCGLLESEILSFQTRIPRPQVGRVLARSHVGFSVAPPVDVNKEMSPTKLSEYMGAGLAVIATEGIPLQDKFMNESEAGWLVNWSTEDIARVICEVSKSHEEVNVRQRKAQQYASNKLKYELYLSRFLKVI